MTIYALLKRISNILTLVVFSSILLFGQKSPKDKFTYSQLNQIQMPKVDQFTLSNGMRIFLIEDHQYPTIDFRAMIGTGSIYESTEKIGLATVVGTVIRTGGTEKMPGDKLDKLLENLGAYIETYIEQDAGYVYSSLLKEDMDKGIEIMADLLMHPTFPEDKIELAKIEQKSWISRRNDDIWSITDREFRNLIYGKLHPFARNAEYSTINSISKSDIVSFYNKYFHPNNIILAAWGDFDANDIYKKIEAAFSGWQKQTINFQEKPQVNYEYKSSVNFVQKSDVNQSHIQLGHIGGRLDDPDYPALVIMNQILSADRMFKVLRTREGLTYAPWGYYGADYDHQGIFNCGTQTKSSSTVYAIQLLLKEVKRITEEEVTDEELLRAKDSYLNSYVFNFDSKGKIINRLMSYTYHNYPMDFTEKTRAGVEKVTKADILRAAKNHLNPEHLQILVVGNKKDFDLSLESLGSVNEIDISIPAENLPEAKK